MQSNDVKTFFVWSIALQVLVLMPIVRKCGAQSSRKSKPFRASAVCDSENTVQSFKDGLVGVGIKVRTDEHLPNQRVEKARCDEKI
jgi:hypothetical protein